jgi:hypothetical protein
MQDALDSDQYEKIIPENTFEHRSMTGIMHYSTILNRKESKYQTPDKRKPKVLGCPDSVKTDKKTDSHA